MGIVLADIKKVARIGRSLSFILPSSFAKLLGVSSSTLFYVSCGDGCVTYSLEPPEGRHYFAVKARVQARFGSHEYYVLTIPRRCAEGIGVSEGDEVLVRLEGGRILLQPLGTSTVPRRYHARPR